MNGKRPNPFPCRLLNSRGGKTVLRLCVGGVGVVLVLVVLVGIVIVGNVCVGINVGKRSGKRSCKLSVVFFISWTLCMMLSSSSLFEIFLAWKQTSNMPPVSLTSPPSGTSIPSGKPGRVESTQSVEGTADSWIKKAMLYSMTPTVTAISRVIIAID